MMSAMLVCCLHVSEGKVIAIVNNFLLSLCMYNLTSASSKAKLSTPHMEDSYIDNGLLLQLGSSHEDSPVPLIWL